MTDDVEMDVSLPQDTVHVEMSISHDNDCDVSNTELEELIVKNNFQQDRELVHLVCDIKN
jgi:hypothetical protein